MGIDAGTSGIKALVMYEKGNPVGTGYRECNVTSLHPNWAEQRPEDWWDACDQAVAQAAAACGHGREIRAIGFSGQMQGCTPFDKEMQPDGPSLIWLDQRSSREARELNQRLDPAEILPLTGGYCLPSFWAAKLLWLRRHEPRRFERIHQVLFAKDYLRYRMTGEIATDVSDASLTFLLDLNTRTWSPRLFALAGLPMEIAPRQVLESQQVAGTLRRELAERWGMTPGIPVVAGGGDQPVGGVGCGAVRPGVFGATIGTSGVVFGCCDTPFVDRNNQGILSTCHSVPGRYDFLGCTLAAGGSFKWLRDNLFARRKGELAAQGKDVYDEMTALAATSPAGSEGLCFLPYLNGESTPHVDADARGVFFGLSYRHGLGDICRSVMEGVTFSLRDTIQILRESGTPVRQVRAMGGGAKSALWRQIQADIYGAQVVTTNMEEGPAAGAAILAAVGAGCFASVEEACDRLIRVTSVTDPIPSQVERYDQYYQTYRRLYPALAQLYREQAAIVAQDSRHQEKGEQKA